VEIILISDGHYFLLWRSKGNSGVKKEGTAEWLGLLQLFPESLASIAAELFVQGSAFDIVSCGNVLRAKIFRVQLKSLHSARFRGHQLESGIAPGLRCCGRRRG